MKKWVVHLKGGPNLPFEIAVVREDFSHGFNSYGWFGENKIFISSSGGPCGYTVSESVWNGLIGVANRIADELNNDATLEDDLRMYGSAFTIDGVRIDPRHIIVHQKRREEMSNAPIDVLDWVDGAIRAVEWSTDANLPLRANAPEARDAIAGLIDALRDSHFEVVRLRGAMFRVYSVAANGGNPNDAIEKMRDVMDASWSGDKAIAALARVGGAK